MILSHIVSTLQFTVVVTGLKKRQWAEWRRGGCSNGPLKDSEQLGREMSNWQDSCQMNRALYFVKIKNKTKHYLHSDFWSIKLYCI